MTINGMLPRKVSKLATSVQDDFNDFETVRKPLTLHNACKSTQPPKKYFVDPNHTPNQVQFTARLIDVYDSHGFSDQHEEPCFKDDVSEARSDLDDAEDDFLELWLRRSTFMRE